MVAKWVTPERQQKLAELAEKYAAPIHCLKGHPGCTEFEDYVQVKHRTEAAYAPFEPGMPVWNPKTGKPVPMKKYGLDETYPDPRGSRSVRQTVYSLQDVPVETSELSHLYGQVEERAVESWKAEDREERAAARKEASQTLPTGEVGQWGKLGRGRLAFDPVRMDEYCQTRPEYYGMGKATDPATGALYSKVRVAGTSVILFVDVSKAVQNTSNYARKRMRRKGVNPQTEEELVAQAVRSWWTNKG